MTNLTERVEQTGKTITDQVAQATEVAQEHWDDLTEDRLSDLIDKKDEIVSSVQAKLPGKKKKDPWKTPKIVGTLAVGLLAVLTVVFLPSLRRMRQTA